MRVPDLDWPADLFKDVIVYVPETIAIFPSMPSLWTEMAKAWMGDDLPDVFGDFVTPEAMTPDVADLGVEA
jgi:hypothetical protein